VVVDDLSTGYTGRLDGDRLVRLDLASDTAPAILEDVLREERIDAVLHFAARKQVHESVKRPAWYYAQNVGSLANLLLAMESADVSHLVFSSSAAVYGAVEGDAVAESAPTHPVNPYGRTKLIGEQLIDDAAVGSGLSAVSLRYFNVGGAGWPDLADRAVLNLVPMVFERIDAGLPPVIFGDDYPTVDGTCVRDYVHVLDLADAHIAALDHLDAGGHGHQVFNVGTGEGTSVRAMIDEILAVAGSDLVPEVHPRRPGDPASVVASPVLIAEKLGWRAERGLREIVRSAWEAHLTGSPDE
jgi:UDP-glucose 4-epimerase